MSDIERLVKSYRQSLVEKQYLIGDLRQVLDANATEIESLRADNDRLRKALEKLLDDSIRLAHASYAQLGACSPPTDPAWHETWKAEDPESFDLAEQARAALAKAASS